MKHLYLLVAGAALAAQANAQTVLNYWDFSSTNDVVGGVTAAAVGTPDLSVHATYGEAYPGAGASLNTVFNVQSYLIGDVWNGSSATALDFGTGDFSFSYWSYDDTSDGNTVGPRIFDFLDGTTTGVQLGTNATSVYNLRIDTSDGGATITNTAGLGALVQPANAWTHVAVNVDRTNGTVEVFFNGASQGTVNLVAPSAGSIRPTRDMDIGVINTDGTQNQVQSAGLDDLAFYDGLLSAGDVAGLAAGTLTPLSFAPAIVASYCFGDGTGTPCPCANNGAAGEGCANSTGAGALLGWSGSNSVVADDLAFAVSGMPVNQFVLLFAGESAVNGGLGNAFGNGLRCAGTNVVRLGVRVADGTGAATWGPGLAALGGWSAGTTRYFQGWYRDPAAIACGDVFNLSNGVQVDFQ